MQTLSLLRCDRGGWDGWRGSDTPRGLGFEDITTVTCGIASIISH